MMSHDDHLASLASDDGMPETSAVGAIYLTENGYALCPRHMAEWREGGWNGAAEGPMSAREATDLDWGEGINHELGCADCADYEII
jgi:hypothetical protein